MASKLTDTELTVGTDGHKITGVDADGKALTSGSDLLTVLNLNASTDSSQIGTVSMPFANTWTQNLNNVPVTDSTNPSLTVSGASSIVGAVNQINRDLMKAMLVADMSISGTTGGYIQFESGLMIQWAKFSGWDNGNGNRCKLPKPFIDKNYFVARGDAGTGTGSGHDYNTTFIVDVQTLGGASWQGGGWFIVIGRWK